MSQTERKVSTGFWKRRTQEFVNRSGPFLLAILTIAGGALIADLTGHVKHESESPGPFDPFKRAATSENLQGGLGSERVLSCLEALSRLPRSEKAQIWQTEIPFAQTLYEMCGQRETKALAIKIAESLNQGEFEVFVGSYVPDKGGKEDLVVGTDFVVSTWATAEGAEQRLGTFMYINGEKFNSLTLAERVQEVASQFLKQKVQREEILILVAGGMGLDEAIVRIQGPR